MATAATRAMDRVDAKWKLLEKMYREDPHQEEGEVEEKLNIPRRCKHCGRNLDEYTDRPGRKIEYHINCRAIATYQATMRYRKKIRKQRDIVTIGWQEALAI